MAKKSGGKVFGLIVWILTALGSINLGLIPAGKSFFQAFVKEGAASPLFAPFHYIIGIAGLISLIMFIQVLRTGDCGYCKKR